MLKSFTVSNFKAFAEPITIDFSATGNYEFNKEAVKDGIVKTGVMYGKNASGKSSLGLAIFDIVGTLTDNFFNQQKYDNFANRFSQDGFIDFKYVFSFDGKDIIYSYKKSRFSELYSEELTINNKLLIKYNRSEDKTKIVINMKGAENVNLNLNQLHF